MRVSRHKGQFKVTTKKGRKIAYACSKEQAEYIKDSGRGRLVWLWCNRKQKYI